MFAHLAVGGRFGRLLRIIVIFFGRRTTGPFRVVAIHAAIPLGRQLFFVHDTPQSSPFPALVAFDPRGIGRARGLTKNGSAIAIQIFFAHEVADNVTVGRSRSSGSRSIAQSRRGNRTCGGQGGHVTIGTTVTGGRHGGAGSFEGYLFLAALLFVVIVIVVGASSLSARRILGHNVTILSVSSSSTATATAVVIIAILHHRRHTSDRSMVRHRIGKKGPSLLWEWTTTTTLHSVIIETEIPCRQYNNDNGIERRRHTLGGGKQQQQQ
mmetsp:Transcript_7941/g.16649  ORF Transcript_7941/g.16649 Transcript_7941/m.16649 type:complete len:267 (-) Transcript_7941:1418-2218(-)